MTTSSDLASINIARDGDTITITITNDGCNHSSHLYLDIDQAVGIAHRILQAAEPDGYSGSQ